MKNRIINGLLTGALAFCLTMFSAVYANDRDSGGGDPLEIAATPYPNPESLDQAVALLRSKIEVSQYSADFKNRFTAEMDILKADGKYLYLPVLIVLGPGAGPEGYTLPQDIHRFVTLGAMTKILPGTPIYFSERVTKYSTEDLARVIAHEIIHHLVEPDVSRDETFVEALAGSIIREEYSRNLAFGIQSGVIVRKDFVSTVSLCRTVVESLLKTLKMGRANIPVSAEEAKKMAQAYDFKIKANETNAAGFKVLDIANYIASIMTEVVHWDRVMVGDPINDLYRWVSFWRAPITIENLAKEFNADNAVLKGDRDPGCKEKRSWFVKSCDKPILVKELFNAGDR